MATYTAKKLFDQNIESAKNCATLYTAIAQLNPGGVDVTWVLRAALVFSVSSLDAYFHDKIRYRGASFKIDQLPNRLAEFSIKLQDVSEWKKFTSRPGNFIRNVLVRHYAVRPLQKRSDIEEALKLVGISSLWNTIEPNAAMREMALTRLSDLVQRRNHISHEGDRIHTRKGGKRLRAISPADVDFAIKLVTAFVVRIEHHFPK